MVRLRVETPEQTRGQGSLLSLTLHHTMVTMRQSERFRTADGACTQARV